MRMLMRFLAAAIVASPVFAADHPDFRLWKADELKRRDAALSPISVTIASDISIATPTASPNSMTPS